MTGTLSQSEITNLLHTHFTGHLACTDEKGPFVVPFTYYYDRDSNSLISYTAEGRKINAMRKDPRVCVNVLDMKFLNRWESVVIDGVFEELEGMPAMNAIKLLITRLKEQINSSGHEKVDSIADMSHSSDSGKKVIYRIRIGTATGRFERPGQS